MSSSVSLTKASLECYVFLSVNIRVKAVSRATVPEFLYCCSISVIVRIVAVPAPFFVLSFLSSDETSEDSLQGLLEKALLQSAQISSLTLLNRIVMILRRGIDCFLGRRFCAEKRC